MTLADGTRVELRRGWRRLFYRGRHHKRSATAASLVLFSAVYLR